jgi:hypothetical protein
MLRLITAALLVGLVSTPAKPKRGRTAITRRGHMRKGAVPLRAAARRVTMRSP